MQEDILESVIENQIDTIVTEPESVKTETISAIEEVTPVHVTKTLTNNNRKKDYKQPMTQEVKLNKLELVILNEPIEIINLTTGTTNNIIPKVAGKVKLANTNLYRIPITNRDYSLDNFYAIKHYAKYAEYFRIVSVSNGKVSIVPIISGFELKSGDVIGELI